jgi:hypothetical protein
VQHPTVFSVRVFVLRIAQVYPGSSTFRCMHLKIEPNTRRASRIDVIDCPQTVPRLSKDPGMRHLSIMAWALANHMDFGRRGKDSAAIGWFDSLKTKQPFLLYLETANQHSDQAT